MPDVIKRTTRSPLSLVLLIALALVVLVGCSSAGATATDWFFGDSLAVRVKQTKFAPQVSYSLCLPARALDCTVSHYVIKTSQEDRTILAAQIEVFNRQATVAFLSIHKFSLRLTDQDYFEYRPLDPFQDSVQVEQPGPNENTFLPFLWADGSEYAPTISMPDKCGPDQNCVLVGWVFFEVPKNTKPTQIIWEAANTIYMRFTGS